MKLTLRALAKKFYAFSDTINTQSTLDNYRRYIQGFIKAVKKKYVCDLKPVDLITWGTTWHRVQAVQRLFSWATQEAELVKRNPFRKVRKPPVVERKRIMTRLELLTLCRRADKAFRAFLVAMVESIARPQEVRALQWEFLRSRIDGEDVLTALTRGNAFFCLEEFKARKRRREPNKPRIILISKRLARLLLRLARKAAALKGPIFANLSGKPWTGNAVRCRMRHLRKVLGWKKDFRGEDVVAYSVRHTQATRAAARGVRDKILAELMGHTSTRTTERYQHLDIEHLRDGFDRFQAKAGHGQIADRHEPKL